MKMMLQYRLFSNIFSIGNKIILILLLFTALPKEIVYAQATIRIMPLGNSITRGTMCTNGDIYSCTDIADADAIGYRDRLFNLLTAAGHTKT